jgi:hypothetical protein
MAILRCCETQGTDGQALPHEKKCTAMEAVLQPVSGRGFDGIGVVLKAMGTSASEAENLNRQVRTEHAAQTRRPHPLRDQRGVGDRKDRSQHGGYARMPRLHEFTDKTLALPILATQEVPALLEKTLFTV